MTVVTKTGFSLSIGQARNIPQPVTGNCFSFAANGDYLGPVNFAWNTRWSCFFRAYIRSVPLNAARIIDNGGANGILLTGTGVQVTNHTTSVTGTNVLVLNAWHDYGIVYDGSYVNFYRDGFLISQNAMTQDPYLSNYNYYIFNRDTGDRNCDMLVRDFMWFNSAKTQIDIYNLTRGGSDNSSLFTFKLNEGTATAAIDSSGNGYTTTLHGGSWSNYSLSVGINTIGNYRSPVRNYSSRGFTSSLLFDGTQGSLTLGSSNAFPGSLTFSCYMYWNGSNGGFQTIFSKRDSYNVSNLQFSLNITNNNNTIANDTVTSFVNFNIQIPLKRWFFFSWVRNTTDSTEKIYINNILVSTQTMGTYGNGTGALISIGSTQNISQDWFNGYFKEIFITNNALSLNEINNLSNGIRPSSNPWSYLKLNEGSGSTATDSSGYGNNGTITGATWSTQVPSGGLRINTNPSSRIATQ